MLGEIMKGGQASLEIGFLSAIVAIVVGAFYGAVSGLVGGFLDSALMRVVDVLLSIPFLFVVLIVAVRYGASVLSLSLILGAFTWLVPARLVRGEVLSLRVRDFVSAARLAGSSQWRLSRTARDLAHLDPAGGDVRRVLGERHQRLLGRAVALAVLVPERGRALRDAGDEPG